MSATTLYDPIAREQRLRRLVALKAKIDAEIRDLEREIEAQLKARKRAEQIVGRKRKRGEREHGTERGYFQHIYRNDPACEPCLLAHSIEERVRRRERNKAREQAEQAAEDEL